MILVDTSVWIDFLHARDTRQTTFLKTVLGTDPLVTADLVLPKCYKAVGTRPPRPSPQRSYSLAIW